LASSRQNGAAAELLPTLHLAVRVPIFREAKYSEAAGFSLPPYVKDGQKDATVALHLARWGDVEAARKLADPLDAATNAAIAKLAGGKNYPVEWTRLTALALYSAQLK